MKLDFRPLAIVTTVALAVLIPYFIVNSCHQSARILDLEQRNEALSKLCGTPWVIPCDRGETGPQCQARMGDEYEVIYYPRAGVFIAELKPHVDSGGSEAQP